MNQTEIAHAYEVEFGERTMPKNAYEIATKSAILSGCTHEVMVMNGWEIASKFGPYYKSTASMESATAMILAEYYGRDVPRIRFMADQVGMPPPVISNEIRNQLAAYMTRNVVHIEDSEMKRILYAPPSTLTERLDPRIGISRSVRMAELLDDNLSQHTRRMQSLFESNATKYIRLASQALDAFAHRYNASWEIRPLLAMPGNDYRTIHTLSPTAGIIDQNRYLSVSNLKAFEIIDTFNLFPDLDPVESLYNYHTWFNSCNMGRIMMHDCTIGLMPLATPPQLVEPTRTSIPFFTSDLIEGHLVRDQIAVYRKLSQVDIQCPIYNVDPGMIATKAARVLQILLASCSLILAAQNWGRGNRKPSWLMSPCNIALIKHIHIVAEFEIAELQEICEA